VKAFSRTVVVVLETQGLFLYLKKEPPAGTCGLEVAGDGARRCPLPPHSHLRVSFHLRSSRTSTTPSTSHLDLSSPVPIPQHPKNIFLVFFCLEKRVAACQFVDLAQTLKDVLIRLLQPSRRTPPILLCLYPTLGFNASSAEATVYRPRRSQRPRSAKLTRRLLNSVRTR
jgi:hypothetical protein